jgi:hypothetical protein
MPHTEPRTAPQADHVLRSTEPFPTSVPEGKDKTSGADLARSNEVVSATGRPLNYPKRGQPDANVNTPSNGPVVER